MFMILASTSVVFVIVVAHVFSFRCYGNLKIYNGFIMGKVKAGLYFYLTIGILTKV